MPLVATRRWLPSDKVALLAWVELCRERKIDFTDSVIQHLEKVTGNDYTMEEIEHRLLALWRRYRSPDWDPEQNEAMTMADIIKLGSQCMPKLEKEDQEEIKSEVAHFRQLCEKEVSGRSSKSSGQLGTSSASNEKKRRNDVFHQGPKDGKSGSSVEGPPKKKVRQQDVNTKAVQENRIQSSTAQNMTLDSNNSKSSGVVARLTGNGMSELPVTPTRNDEVRSSNEWRILLESTKQNHKLEMSQKQAEIRSIQALWYAEVEDRIAAEKKLKQSNGALQAEVQHLDLARQEREAAGRDPLESSIFLKNQEIWRWSQHVHSLQKLVGFAKLNIAEGPRLENNDIDDAMDRITSQLESILQGRDLDQPLLVPQKTADSYTNSLIRSALGISIEAVHGRAKLQRLTSKFDSQHLIRVFVLAALCDWVFESAFPDFSPSNLRLLGAYRDTVLKYGGWKGLHDLDLAAHQELIDSIGFKETIIQKKAGDLANRLSKALAPFFVKSSAESGNVVFHTWGEEDETWRDRRFRFITIFSAALSLKAKTVLTNRSYEFSVHPPGTFCHGGDAESHGVDIEESWLHASIYVYQSGPSNLQDASSAVIYTSNFATSRNEGERRGALYRKDIIMAKTNTNRDMGDYNAEVRTEASFGGKDHTKSVEEPNLHSASNEKASSKENDPRPNIEEVQVPDLASGAGDESRSATKIPEAAEQSTHNAGGDSASLTPLPKCTFCKEQFHTHSNFTHHMKKNHLKCTHCEKVLDHKIALQKHCREEHDGELEMPSATDCSSLKKRSKAKRRESHPSRTMNDHPSDESMPKIQQRKGNGSSSKASKKAKDAKVVDIVQSFTASQASKSNGSKDLAAVRRTRISSKSKSLPIDSDDGASSSNETIDHQNVSPVEVAEGAKFSCPICKKGFVWEKKMKAHLNKSHVSGSERKRVKCKECNKDFLRKDLRDKHFHADHANKITVAPEMKNPMQKRHKCPECDKYYTHPYRRDRHHEEMHLGFFRCTICQQRFPEKALREAHQKIGCDKTRKKPDGDERLGSSTMKVKPLSKLQSDERPETEVVESGHTSNGVEVAESATAEEAHSGSDSIPPTPELSFSDTENTSL